MRARPGVVLVLTLLALLVLECVAAAAFHLGTEQLRISRNHERLLRLEAAARAGAAAAIGAWPDSLPRARPGEWIPLPAYAADPGIQVSLAVLDLSGGRYLLRARALGDAGERRTIGMLLHERRPVDYLAALEAVVVARRALAAGAAISLEPAGSCPDAASAPALPAAALADTLGSDGALQLAASPVGNAVAGIDFRAFGPPALRIIRGDYVIRGDSMGGILLVLGNVEFTASSRFAGLLLATGNVTLDAGAVLEGALHASGDVLLDHATIRYEPCLLLPALSADALRGPFPAGTHWYLPFL